MANKVKDLAAVTQSVRWGNTSGVPVPLVTVGPTEIGTLARVVFWVSSASTDGQFSIYRGSGVSGTAILTNDNQGWAATVVDNEPASEYTLAVIGDSDSGTVLVTLSVDQIG
jgi:hypothetical protein